MPTLWALLSPESERPEYFCVGNRKFDPEKVGYETDCKSRFRVFEDGYFKYDTNLPGNSNKGHLFTADPAEVKPGWFPGRRLTEDERWFLIEYLKTL